MLDLTFEEYYLYSPYYVDSENRGPETFAYTSFLKEVDRLPTNIKSFFLEDFKLAEFVKKIVLENNLDRGKGKEIAKVIKDSLFTEIYVGNIISEIKNRLEVDDQKAKTIAGLIVTELFAPILEDLKKMHIEKFAKNMPLQSRSVQSQSNQVFDDRVVDLKNL